LVFNSLAFLLFLPTVLLGYFMLPHKFRWILLLIASYFFYGFWKIEYLSLILFSTVVDFSVSQFLDKTIDQTKRKLALGVSLFTNLGLLFFFKYFNWFLDDVANPMGIIPDNALNYWHSNFQFLLPVGISFYTFQTLGYTIDVYYKKAIPEKNFFKFALFVSYFRSWLLALLSVSAICNRSFLPSINSRMRICKMAADLFYMAFSSKCV
jgi:alginate O-acetyltransferase complex protein AlgI